MSNKRHYTNTDSPIDFPKMDKSRLIMGQVLDEKFRHTWTCLNYQDLVVFSEKYMELVVKECAHLADTLNEAYDAPSTTGKFIKAHFGVEE
jgi:hypothetical protein